MFISLILSKDDWVFLPSCNVINILNAFKDFDATIVMKLALYGTNIVLDALRYP